MQALRFIQQEKVCLRADLAKEMKLTPAAITYIINDMLKDRLVKEIGNTDKAGRRSSSIQLDDSYYRICSVVIEKHFFRVAQFTLSGTLINCDSFLFTPHQESLERMERVKKEVLAMIEDVTTCQDRKFLAIGVAINRAMLIYRDESQAVTWDDINIENELRTITGLPVFVESTINCSVMGEQYYANYDKKNNMLLIQMYESDLEMGVVANGSLYKTRFDFAGQIGHTVIDYKGTRCECGKTGCLKQYCSANLITETYCQRQYVLGNRNVEMYPDIIGISQLVNEGDEVAQAVIHEKMVMLCIGILNAIHLFNPDTIVFESNLSPCIDYVYSIFRKELSRQLPKKIFNSLQFVSPSFGHGGSMVYGACALAFSKITQFT